MRVVGNVLWFLLAGVWLAIGYTIAGILNCILIITIPFGIQAFKLAGYALWPFGRVVVRKPDSDVALATLGNVIWFLVSGVWLAIAHVLFGLVLMVTIVGIPLGIASMRLAGLALFPFGKRVVPRADARAGEVVMAGPESLG